MPNKAKSLSKGGVYYLIYNVINLAFPFLTGIYVARILLPQDIGSVAAARNLAQYFVILAFLGIPTYGMREIAKVRDNNSERSKVFSELYAINLISTCVFLVCYILLVMIVPNYRESIVLYLIAGVSIALNAFNISWLYEGLEEFKFISIRNIIFKVVSFVLLILFVRNPSDYLLYAGITIIGTAGNYIVNMLFAPRFVRISFHNLHLKRHMKSIFYLVAVNLAIELYSLVDVTMMNFFSKKESITFYKYGHNIYIMLLQVINTFTMVLIPRATYYFKEGKKKEFNDLVSKALRFIILFSAPMIIGIQFTATFLITKMYGQQYINSASILQMFAILLLVSPIGYLLGSRMLLATGNENKMIISVGIGAIINVVGNAVLIPMYSEFGATIASIISEFVVMIVYVYLGKPFFKLNGIIRTTGKVVVSSLAMLTFLFGCKLLSVKGWLLLCMQVSGATFIYAAIILLLHEETISPYFDKLLLKLRKRG